MLFADLASPRLMHLGSWSCSKAEALLWRVVRGTAYSTCAVSPEHRDEERFAHLFPVFRAAHGCRQELVPELVLHP